MQQLEHEKYRRELAERELKVVKEDKETQYRAQQQIRDINDEVHAMSTSIRKELAPAAVKTMKLKQHIQELYVEMGFSKDQAQFRMLRAAEEWDEMAAPVTNILRGGYGKQIEC